jgi:ribonuclease G
VKKLKNKLIITRWKDYIFTILYDGKRMVEVCAEKEDSGQILNNIYVGKVKNIVKNINSAFVDIGGNRVCYYSMEENKKPIFTGQKSNNKLCEGDDIIVQVLREQVKTKPPMVTCNLNFTGKYAVLAVGKHGIGVSNKIREEEEKKRLKEIVEPYVAEDYGFIVRTNAKGIAADRLTKEVSGLIKRYKDLIERGKHRVSYQLLEKSPPLFLSEIRDVYRDILEEIVTDDIEIYEEIREYLKEYQPDDEKMLRLYQDDQLSLRKLYSLEHELDQALREKVWLKSGAYLVIQPTEAFVVIDVNTGKYIGKKKTEETFLKINLEAAEEIARQLRLRNLSGIVVIDFIDMEKEENRELLMERFREMLKKDPVPVYLVGMSKLNLVELTRKKVRRPLHEQLMTSCPCCKGRGYVTDW